MLYINIQNIDRDKIANRTRERGYAIIRDKRKECARPSTENPMPMGTALLIYTYQPPNKMVAQVNP